MKALVLTSSYPTRDDSFEGGFVADLTRDMRMHGIVPAVLAPHFPGGRFKESREGIRIYRFPYFFPLRFQRLAYGAGMPFNISRTFFAFAGIVPFFLMEFVWTLAVLLRERADLIHTHWLIPQGLIGALVHRMTGIPHVTTVHGSDLSMLKKYAFFRVICRIVVKNSSIITVNSSYMRQQLADVAPESRAKLRIIPMGVEPAEFEKHPDENTRTKKRIGHSMLSVGRLIDWKGTVYLIEAMPRVIPRLPDTKLVIIGTGPEEAALRRRADELMAGDSIEFRGSVSQQDLIAAYHAADVFVLPSVNQSGITEGLGVVLLEAMASGCPVIGSNVGGIPDIITDGKNGFLVPERDPTLLADRIIRILSDTGLAETFRKNGHANVNESFTWDRVSGRFASIYSEAAGNHEIPRSERL